MFVIINHVMRATKSGARQAREVERKAIAGRRRFRHDPAMSPGPYPIELLTTAQMARADRLTIESGVPGIELMENAAAAIVKEVNQILNKTSGRRVLVLCGPGNNGGDGYAAARLLRTHRIKVRVASLTPPERLRGDAKEAASRWTNGVEPAANCDLSTVDLVIDAMFGTGLARDLDAPTVAIVERLNQWRRETGQKVVSVDIPSGVDGTTGAIRGAAVEADATITFFRVKSGHLLLPGRLMCGELICAHIGIRPWVLGPIAPDTFVNEPGFWQSALPLPKVDGHKYTRGHAVVVSGGRSFTGAARLAAKAALRSGAGLVTLVSPSEALAINAGALTSVMVREADGPPGLAQILADSRKNAVALGPGLGVGEATCALVEAALLESATPRAAVLDADALMSFASALERLQRAIAVASGPVVLTPHAGEFARLFPAQRMGFSGEEGQPPSKLEQARAAARLSGAVVLYKGPDTVVAAPDGRAAVLPGASPWLATAGSGDVLTGMIAGLLAQRMAAFAAACCAAWMHARAARIFGPGLVADDVIDTLPNVWRELSAK
jgi:hydroxyethylthiazole kinase-like uncharacterized protein yjeF